MAVIHPFPEQARESQSADPIPAHSPAEIARRVPYLQLPEYHISEAGHGDGFDISRMCSVHHWGSLPVPMESGIVPTCKLCDASREFIDGFARYQDFLAKRQAGL